MLRFGPAGMPLACKGKHLSQGIIYTHKLGLRAFEVEFVRGVRIRKEHAQEARKTAKKLNIQLSCHAPYWINCCSPNKEKQQTTLRNLLQTARAAQLLDAKIIVFHPGFYQKLSKSQAFQNALNLLKKLLEKMKDENLKTNLGLETVGKPAAFGSLEENIKLCKSLPKTKLCIDFAHIHAYNNGCIKTKSDYEDIINKIKKKLGTKALKNLHCHFSGIAFTKKGERHHLPVSSNSPPFKPLAELLAEQSLDFTIINESPLLEKDALKMQQLVEKLKG